MIKFDPKFFATMFGVNLALLRSGLNTMAVVSNTHFPPLTIGNLTFTTSYQTLSETYIIQVSENNKHIKTIYVNTGPRAEVWWSTVEHDRKTTLVYPIHEGISQIAFDTLLLELYPWLA